MSVNPNVPAGVAPPQGLASTQTMAPPQAGPPPPSQMPAGPPGQGGVDPAMLAQMLGGGGGPQGQVGPDGQPVQPPKPPKPPSMVPPDVARILAQAINNAKVESANSFANYMGDARGNVNAPNEELVRAWRKRDPAIDPLVEKFINKKSDEDITFAMYPLRRAMIKYGNRTYTEQVEFADRMAEMSNDPAYAHLDEEDDTKHKPPRSKFPSADMEKENMKEDMGESYNEE